MRHKTNLTHWTNVSFSPLIPSVSTAEVRSTVFVSRSYCNRTQQQPQCDVILFSSQCATQGLWTNIHHGSRKVITDFLPISQTYSLIQYEKAKSDDFFLLNIISRYGRKSTSLSSVGPKDFKDQKSLQGVFNAECSWTLFAGKKEQTQTKSVRKPN